MHLIFLFRDQIVRNRLDQALHTMQKLPKFPEAFLVLVQEESRKEARNILKEKDPPKSEFNIDSIREFSYEAELQRFERTNPILLASVIGTISKEKVTDYSEVSRKGFGGSNRAMDIDLLPCVIQTVSRILKNVHPNSLTTITCLNSLFCGLIKHLGKSFNSTML